MTTAVTSTPCDIEVVTFVASEGAYYFVMGDCRRADIIKCRTLQPAIADPLDYSSYMWIKAYQGYFLLRQRFVENRAEEWRVIREVEVKEPEFDFFEQYGDRLAVELDPPGPADDPEGLSGP